MSSTSLKREILGIALLLFAVFLGGAFAALALAQIRAGVSVEASVGLVGTILARPLVTLFGWPAAVLIPLVPAVHALRLFGRLESDTDRSWMIFFAGMVVLLPIGLSLALPAPLPGVNSVWAGLWGGLIEAWWTGWFGAFGAWVVMALAASVLMAATLAWNPIRALVGHRAPANVAEDSVALPGVAVAESKSKRRKKRDDVNQVADGNLALALEPPPDEMPALDHSLMSDGGVALATDTVDGAAADSKKRKKKSKADAAADHDAEIAAAIDATAQVDLAGEELPDSALLAPIPPHNHDASKRELDAMGAKLMEALRTFRVDGDLAGRTTGPVVTQFEIEPAPGVKVRQFANLS
ncbi:MAG TPA: DNA translocase FtsK 4TM domain-containing protein, partial [Gemmatimonadaceae bacterium]